MPRGIVANDDNNIINPSNSAFIIEYHFTLAIINIFFN
jgi:hypothetical protein